MKKQIQSLLTDSIENDKQSTVYDIDILVDGAIQKIKSVDTNNIINISDEDILLIDLVKQHRETQLKKVVFSKEFSFDKIDHSQPISNLLIQHTKHKDRFSTDVLLVLYRLLELEDENKRLTLTDEQYKTWLEISNLTQYITTKQFQILYGLSSVQQKGLRQKLNDPLPHVKLNKNSNILYSRIEVEKWLENYTGKMKI